MSWYKIIAPEGIEGSTAITDISNTFILAYRNSGAKGALLLMNEDVNTFKPQTTNIFYFSPVGAQLCANLISQYHGEPCSAPSPSEASYIVGDEDFLADWQAGKCND